MDVLPSYRKSRDTYPAVAKLTEAGKRKLVINLDKTPVRMSTTYKKFPDDVCGYWIRGTHSVEIGDGPVKEFDTVAKVCDNKPCERFDEYKPKMLELCSPYQPPTLEEFDAGVAAARANLEKYYKAVREVEAYTVDDFLREINAAKNPPPDVIAERKKAFPTGTRLKLIEMRDPEIPVASGTCGSVDHVDDVGTIHMAWDNGRTVGLIPEVDSFEKIEFTDEVLEQLWLDFADIPMDPATEKMEERFLHFSAGTDREEIWHWFDQLHSKGVAHLLYNLE